MGRMVHWLQKVKENGRAAALVTSQSQCYADQDIINQASIGLTIHFRAYGGRHLSSVILDNGIAWHQLHLDYRTMENVYMIRYHDRVDVAKSSKQAKVGRYRLLRNTHCATDRERARQRSGEWKPPRTQRRNVRAAAAAAGYGNRVE